MILGEGGGITCGAAGGKPEARRGRMVVAGVALESECAKGTPAAGQEAR